ncbi:hypothetical protein RFI_31378 [Reticulomyxa filosa]|uniref:Uncharacterized protein n=1 Tax=Reticulomyxa filosa TaxID=46433 RepID=X6LVR0_RETFI|nr:hypothetical protein RFI_31378 [Reticulomyxa filosa]|eukprot:ETO06018.1 hypothetical protein RFI_31378 [Reticulomyxa filosa]
MGSLLSKTYLQYFTRFLFCCFIDYFLDLTILFLLKIAYSNIFILHFEDQLYNNYFPFDKDLIVDKLKMIDFLIALQKQSWINFNLIIMNEIAIILIRWNKIVQISFIQNKKIDKVLDDQHNDNVIDPIFLNKFHLIGSIIFNDEKNCLSLTEGSFLNINKKRGPNDGSIQTITQNVGKIDKNQNQNFSIPDLNKHDIVFYHSNKNSKFTYLFIKFMKTISMCICDRTKNCK